MKGIKFFLVLPLLLFLAFALGCDSDNDGKAQDDVGEPLNGSERFVDNGDGTVTDNMTGLMWEKKVAGSGCLHCVDDVLGWNTSMSDWISEVNGPTDDSTGSTQSGLGGFTDWRIPTLAELLTILDLSEGMCGPGTGPCINPIFGPTIETGYWTSTTLASNASNVWGVNFFIGGVAEFSKSFGDNVRAVRTIGP
ncbi:DUF1566 domain-containing protein [Desulfobacterota bacterium AH_259_B03_O07]|nr:DUF1566 domain-containing protein [Desulfobacterota bacterium AH_259_B03_O07]